MATEIWRCGAACATAFLADGLLTIRYIGPLTVKAWYRVADLADLQTRGRAVALLVDVREARIEISESELYTDNGPARSSLTRLPVPGVLLVPEWHRKMWERFAKALADIGVVRVVFTSFAPALARAKEMALEQRAAQTVAELTEMLRRRAYGDPSPSQFDALLRP